MEEQKKRGRPRKVVVEEVVEEVEVVEEDNSTSVMLGVLGLASSVISFFAGMFIFQIVGILLAGFAPKKTELHWLAIGVGIISLIVDLITINQILYY